MNRARHLLQSSILVILFFGIGKITGLIRTRLVGISFGTGADLDAFNAANQLPEVFFVLIAGGGLAAAFIPVYANYLQGEPSRSQQLANTVLTLVILLLGLLSALGALFAPWLTQTLLVPDFSLELQTLTAAIMRVILIQTTIFGIGGVLSSMLNAHQHFALPALAPLALDIGYFVGIYLFVPRMGIMGLAWGTVVGSVLNVLIQVPALIKYRLGYQPALQWRLDGVHEIVRLMGPRIIILGAIQVADLFIIRTTSGLPAGSTSGYFFGYALFQFPETLLGTAIALVVFPTMAELFNAKDIDGLKQTAVNSLSIIWTLTIPAAVGLILLGRQAIVLFFEGGAFDAASTALVYSVLVVFSVRLISEASLEIVARLFYAQHNTGTPMFAYLGWLVIQVLFTLWLVNVWGIVGIALASTIAFTFLATLLFWLNARALGGLAERPLVIAAARALLAAGGMALAIWGSNQLFDSPLLQLAGGGLFGSLSYAALHLLLGGKEIPDFIHIMLRREHAASEVM